MAKYAYFGGVRPAVKRFSKEFGKDLRENTVRDWVKAYRKELGRKRTLTEIGDDLAVTELPAKKRGRPLLLGKKIDAEIKAIITAMRDNGAVVNTAIAIATATGVIRKRDKSLLIENGGPLELTKNWAKSLLFRMGFVKRRGNTKAKVSVEHFETLKTQFLLDIKATVEMQEIPPELIINWDQTGIKIVPVSHGRWRKEVQNESRLQGSTTSGKSRLYSLSHLLGIVCPFRSSIKARHRDVYPNLLFRVTGM